jgi:hypothetical protein
MLGFSVVAGLAILTTSDQTVTYETVAKPVARVLLDLSHKLDRRFTVDDQIGIQPIIISVKDVPAQELLDRIAHVCYGHWTKDQGVDSLSLDSDAVNNAEQAYTARVTRGIGAQIAATNAEIEASGLQTQEQAAKAIAAMGEQVDNSPTYDQLLNTGMFKCVPSTRLLAKLLKLIGPGDIARVRGRTVFSSAPNDEQKPMSGSVVEALDAYVTELGSWLAAQSGNPPSQILFVLSEPMLPVLLKDIAKVEVSVEGDDDAYIATLLVLGSDGTVLDATAVKLTPNVETPNVAEKSDGRSIPLSPEASWTLKPGKSAQDAPKGLLTKLERPDEFEPLSWDTSEILIGYAKALGDQLVALVPDRELYLTDSQTPSVGTVRNILASSEDLDAWEAGDKSTWLQIRCRDSQSIFRERANRQLLAQLLDPARTQGGLDLGDYCRYEARAYQPHAACLEWCLEATTLDGPGDALVCAFYGALDETSLDSMKNGEPLHISELSADARGYLEKLVFGDSSGLTGYGFVKRAGSDDNLGEPELRHQSLEPTDLLPTGIPDDGEISVTEKNDSGVFIKVSPSPGSTSGPVYAQTSIEDLVTVMNASKDRSSKSELPDWNDLRLGSTMTREFKFTFTKDLTAHFSQLLGQTHGEEKYTLDTLPDAIKQEIAAEQVKQEDAKKSAQGTNPP